MFWCWGVRNRWATYSDSFEVVDRKQRIYSKKRNAVRHSWEDFGRDPGLGLNVPQSGAGENSSPLKNIQKFVDRMLLAEYAPAGVIVDDGLHVLQVRGETSHYLQIPPGEPTTDLTRMVRPGLLAALRSAIRKARQQGIQVKEMGLRVQGAGRCGMSICGFLRFAIRIARSRVS